ncbi:MAG TPA: transcription antitermination factor NusB [Candidatus Binataceae bacterium]|jgi:N utilization substance protein B|nr:transcription antitermination factor NusB [Candidatus Binataceae bacterium]
MGLRHAGRELALKALYQRDIRGNLAAPDLALLFEVMPADERSRLFALRLIDGVQRETELFDREIAATLEHWSLSRLSRVDHNILRLAVCELLRMAEIPTRVTIDEAIELAKAYGDRDSAKFVNGVLDKLAQRLGVRDKGEAADADKTGQP